MNELRPDTYAALGRRVLKLNAMTSGLGVVLVSLYLMAALHLSREQWMGFATIVAGWYALLLPASVLHFRSFQRAIGRYLELRAAGRAEPGDLRAAYVECLDLPRRTALGSFGWWCLGGLCVALSMKLRFPDFRAWNALVLFVSATSGGALAAIFLGFGLKAALGPLREAFASEVGAPEERGRWVRRLPLVWKLRVAITAATAVPLGFAAFFAQAQLARPVEGLVSQWQHRILEEARESGRLRPDALLPTLAALHLDSQVVVLDRRTGSVLEGPSGALEASEVRAILHDPGAAGDGLGIDSSHIFSWRLDPQDARRVVALVTPWSSVSGALGSVHWVFAFLLLTSGGVALGVARVLARDVGVGTELLRAEAERLASGDLRPGRVLESEDELGDLGRAFARMGGALRDTVGRVAEAADRVEATAREMEMVGEGVAAVTVDQVRGIQQVTVSMDGIHSQAEDITGSSQRLSTSVEESSSSVLELGASGEELSHTASVLSEQVTTVSSSIEQMIASVRLVAESTESLAAAAEETSSSMEEMASTMREVDAAAADTGRLSMRVVEMAEVGCDQVRETIQGMEAIREATEAAERVIHGLGEHAQKIGSILDVIEDVADETNLLALNASIIAAQSGEQGRAFAVVADEIKDLAERVLSSTQEIAGVVRGVQEESQAAVGAVERGSASVVEGVERSAQAGISLEEITRVARESGERMESIVEAVRQQTKAAAHVAELMERVRTGVESIRAATREQERGSGVVLGGSARMRDVAQQVHRTTEEQARGTTRLRASMEAVRDAVQQIHAALEEQSSACRKAAEFMEHVYARTRQNEQAAQHLGRTTRALRSQARSLREDVQRFRL